MVKGLTQTSATIAVGFQTSELVAGTFAESQTDLNLSPLDNEVFVILAVNLDVVVPDNNPLATSTCSASITATSQDTIARLSNANCWAAAGKVIVQDAVGGTPPVAFQTALETTPATLDYIGICATSDFFVQLLCTNNQTTKIVTGKIYGYRARASSSIYNGLVQSQVLSA